MTRRGSEEGLEEIAAYLHSLAERDAGLSRVDEVRLSGIIHDLADRENLSVAEERVLAEAKQVFVRSNLRLVAALARRYHVQGMPLDDLVQEGNIGLMRAVELFDGRKGFRFSTYASWWIKQAILEAISSYKSEISLPRNLRQELAALQKSRQELQQRLGREPSPQELSEDSGIEPLRAAELQTYVPNVLSLEASPLSDGESDITLGDMVADTASLPIEGTIVRRDLSRVIGKALQHLDLRERQILAFRFGLEGQQPHTIEEAAEEFGVSRERIRQVEVREIARLRKNDAGSILRDVMRD